MSHRQNPDNTKYALDDWCQGYIIVYYYSNIHISDTQIGRWTLWTILYRCVVSDGTFPNLWMSFRDCSYKSDDLLHQHKSVRQWYIYIYIISGYYLNLTPTGYWTHRPGASSRSAVVRGAGPLAGRKPQISPGEPQVGVQVGVHKVLKVHPMPNTINLKHCKLNGGIWKWFMIMV